MSNLLLVGGGGHCHSCIDVIELEGRFKILGVFDNKFPSIRSVMGYPVLGNDGDIGRFCDRDCNALITVGQVHTPDHRMRLFNQVVALGVLMPVVTSPSSTVSAHSRLGAGSIVMHGSVVNSGAIIGRNCIINCQSLVEHDVVVGSHSHISTGAILNGNVKIGRGSFIGSGAVVHHGVTIGARAVVAAGSVVSADVPAGTWVGVKQI